jgi:adenosine deaminase
MSYNLNRLALCVLLPALAASRAQVQRPAGPTPLTQEQHAARAFDAAKKQGAPELYAFLAPMPKGADLHMHLSGAIYAETFLAEAVQLGLCIDPTALKLTQPASPATCADGNVPAASVLKNQHLYDAMVDAFSMRAFVPTPGVTGHDQFFATFDRFSGLGSFMGAWLDEVATRAAAQNEQYLEIMTTPPFSHAAGLGYQIGWPADAAQSVSVDELAALRTALLAAGLKQELPVDRQQITDALEARNKTEQCDVPEKALPACHVQIHFLYQVLRAFPPEQVFAQTLLGFEVAAASQSASPDAPDVVGINFVQPEDDRRAMADYHLQMQMLDYLHSVYPNVKISLHAGELAPGLVPYEGMSFHIREAVELGHASRIGHGVDALYETDSAALLKEMAAQHVMVEINLTSNDGILGIKGTEHPLTAYRAAHVPVALSTDDEGVSRIDLTHEYVRAAEEQGLSYFDLKQMARTSLEHAFLAGDSLWATPDDFSHRKPDCAGPIAPPSPPASATPTPPPAPVAPAPTTDLAVPAPSTAPAEPAPDPCRVFLKANERAAQQYELERRFATFEAAQP